MFLREGKEHSCPKFEHYYKRNIRSDRSWLKYEPGGRKHGAKPGLCVLTEALSRHSQERVLLLSNQEMTTTKTELSNSFALVQFLIPKKT